MINSIETDITIVPATDEHYELAKDISVKAWTPIRQEFKKLLGEDIYKPFFENWQEAKRRDIENGLKTGCGYIALMSGKTVGFVYYFTDDNTKTGEIAALAVDPEVKGHGIGNKLCEYALAKMRECGMLHAVVTTGGDDSHAPARRTYEKNGFQKFLPSVKYFMNL